MAEVKVLVTGAAGLVGSALVRTGEVTGLDRTQLDITDPNAFREALRCYQPVAVINAAAQAGVDRADAEPDLTALVNAVAPGEMAVIAASEGVRFVHLSTDYVLDSPELDRLDEGVTPCPRSTYARTKLEGEQRALEEGATVVRLQWVYHPGARGFFNHALQSMRDGASVRLVTDQVGCPTPAELIAPMLVRIARSGPAGLFHLATQGEATAWEWIQAGAAASGVDFRATQAKRSDFDGAHRPARSVLDSTKAQQAWGLELPHWRDALRTVVAGSDRLITGAAQ